jgi:hypothetical protein
MASKRGDVLLLSDRKFADYQRYREEQARERQSPVSSDPIPASLHDDVSQRAEQLIAEELANHFTKVLTSVGLAKDAEKLKPIHGELPKFKDGKHFKSTMQRLHSRTSSRTTLPATPVTPATETNRRRKDSEGFTSLRKGAESRASADFDTLQRQIKTRKGTAETERVLRRPQSTHPYSNEQSAELPLLSFTPAPIKVSTPTLTKKVLNHYINEVALALPKDTDLSTKSSEEKKPRFPLKSKRKRKIRRVVSADISETSSPSASFLREPNMYRRIERSKAINWRESEAIRQQVYWKRVLADIKSQYTRKRKPSRSGSIGELMEIMFHKKPEINQDEAKHGDIAKFRTLNQKLYTMMKEDPAELHRITTQPEFMRQHLVATSAQRQAQWTEEHEVAFKSLLRKTHSFNSIAKTRMFKEQEKELPEKKTMRDMEWKNDLHSPWVNDLDYNGDQFLAVGEDMEVAPAQKSSISNIRRGYFPPTDVEPDAEAIETKKLREKTGLLYANLYRLRKASERMDQKRDFEDAITGFEMINTWEQHHQLFDQAKARLASHILAGSKIDMMMLNKARYSYLSAKIAHQRASNELSSKVMQEAETMRKQLREKQEALQREITIARHVCRQLYPTMTFTSRRAIKTTSYALGSPLFRPMMVKMGFLREDIEAKPRRLRAFSMTSRPTVQLSPQSQTHVSRLNNTPKHEKQPNPAVERKRRAERLMERLQARMRGYMTRWRVARLRKAARMGQKGFRRHRLLKAFLKGIIKAQETANSRALASIILSFRSTFLYRQIQKELAYKPLASH